MAKRKKQSNQSLVILIVLCLGVLATLTIFLPALVTGSGDNKLFYSGLDVTFGKTLANLGVLAKGKIPFSILALLAYLLPIIAGTIVLFAPKKKPIAMLLFLAAAVLLFLLPEYINMVSESSLFENSAVTNLGGSLTWGSIMGAVFSVLGLFGTGYLLVK